MPSSRSSMPCREIAQGRGPARARTAPRSSRDRGRSEPVARRDAGRGSRRASRRGRAPAAPTRPSGQRCSRSPGPTGGAPAGWSVVARGACSAQGRIGDRFEPDLQSAGCRGLAKKLTFRDVAGVNVGERLVAGLLGFERGHLLVGVRDRPIERRRGLDRRAAARLPAWPPAMDLRATLRAVGAFRWGAALARSAQRLPGAVWCV